MPKQLNPKMKTWIEHVKAVQKKYNCSYKEAMIKAKSKK